MESSTAAAPESNRQTKVPAMRSTRDRRGITRRLSVAGSPSSSLPDADLLHGRRRPRAIQDRGLGPIGADVQGELRVLGRWQPVRFLVWTQGLGLHLERQGAVGAELERLVVLGAQRIAILRG